MLKPELITTYIHCLFSRYEKTYRDRQILHKLAKHEELDCDVCYKEEVKSKTLKLNKTKILHNEIIPSNQCWICDLTFQDGEAQVQHFLNEHECQFCIYNWYFEDSALKKKHFSEEHAICDHCGEVFEYNFQKENHIKEKHEADNIATAVATSDEQTNFQTMPDKKTSKPRADRKHRKICSIQ